MEHLLRVEMRGEAVRGDILGAVSFVPDQATRERLNEGGCRVHAGEGLIDIFGQDLQPFETGAPLGFDLIQRSSDPLITIPWQYADLRMVAPMGTLAHVGKHPKAAHFSLPWTSSANRPHVVSLSLPAVMAQITWRVRTTVDKLPRLWVIDQYGGDVPGSVAVSDREGDKAQWNFTTDNRIPLFLTSDGPSGFRLRRRGGLAPVDLPMPSGDNLRGDAPDQIVAQALIVLWQ